MKKDEKEKQYWRSLEDLRDDPRVRKFREEEFPGLDSEKSGPLPRRSFLKIMGASMALAGAATGCRFPVEKIAPHAGRPMDRKPGVPEFYNTAFELGGFAQGLTVKSYDGRPVKIEGNTNHPLNRGASDARAQASILSLYDPDRSKNPVRKARGGFEARTWEEFDNYFAKLIDSHRAGGGSGLCIVAGKTYSPTANALRKQFHRQFPRAIWIEHEPVSTDNEVEGIRRFLGGVGGHEYRPLYDLAESKTILSIDSDFLYNHPASVKYARDFAGGRTADDGGMNRLYCVESSLSVTGACADHRLALPPSLLIDFTLALGAELFVKRSAGALKSYPALFALLKKYESHSFDTRFMKPLGEDLLRGKGRSAVVAGGRMPPALHLLVMHINSVLGNMGRTLSFVRHEAAGGASASSEKIEKLTAEANAGRIRSVVILGCNPAYDSPADIDTAAALKKIENAIHLGLYHNETAQQCGWHIPMAHYLESWGDARDYTGGVSIVQPLIQPLYDGRTATQILSLAIDGKAAQSLDLVKKHSPAAGAGWDKALYDGYIAASDTDRRMPPMLFSGDFDEESLQELKKRDGGAADNLEINFVPDNSVYDGRFANNAWLQEMPDPVTKLTWDNAALISPATAKKHGIERGDVIKMNYKKRALEIPALVLPGHADGAVTVSLGCGRTKSGSVGDGAGANAYLLRTSDSPHFGTGLTIEKTGRSTELAVTQDHQAIGALAEKEKEKRRGIHIREADLGYYKEHPDFARHMVHHPPLKSLWTEHEYPGYRWGMAIDLTRCTGCNACLVACQAENNIPVVGRREVALGREMHWIRVDRYFSGDPAAPKVSFQPVPCMQCENAPCEQVCPVAATVHSSEGLNDMVYNRCIGMRFCSNNCPYKVRRFNYYLNHKGVTDIQKLVFNPDVTVRSRGVMEKCTYCVQRIQEAKIRAKNERRTVADGEIAPACAQACPADAIVFGDLNDPHSRVRRLHEHNRSYALLAAYNLKPRTLYLAKLRNPAGGGRDGNKKHKKNHGESGH